MVAWICAWLKSLSSIRWASPLASSYAGVWWSNLQTAEPICAFATEVKAEANLDLELWRQGDSKSLRSTVTIPANGSVVSSVDQLFPGAEEFLDGGIGWYTVHNAPRSVKTISVIEDIPSGTTSGEHGF